MLGRKTLRDFQRQAGLVCTIVLTHCVGVASFVATGGSYLDLSESYHLTQKRLSLAPFRAYVSDSSKEQLDRLNELDELRQVESRLEGFLPVAIPRSGEEKAATVEGKVISLPDASQPSLDRLHLFEGALPGDGEILVERQIANHYGLHRGDAIMLRIGGNDIPLQVSGVATSAEYLWVTRDAQDILPGPHEFGVFWIGRGSWQKLAEQWLRQDDGKHANVIDGLLAIDMENAIADVLGPGALLLRMAAKKESANCIVFDAPPNRKRAEVREAIRGVLGDSVGIEMVGGEELPGVRLLQMNIDGLRGIAMFFPFFFFIVAAVMIINLLTRLIQTQRVTIGTLMALGIPQYKIFLHYLMFSTCIGVMGSVFGIVLGLVSGPHLTRLYAHQLGIFFVQDSVSFLLIVVGGAGGLLVSVWAGLLPSFRASRLEPTEAIRPVAPKPILKAPWWEIVLRPLPFAMKLAVRNTTRYPLRSFGTWLGILMATLLICVTGIIFDSIAGGVNLQTNRVFRHDLLAFTSYPVAKDKLESIASHLPGVQKREVMFNLPVMISHQEHSHQSLLVGANKKPQLMHVLDSSMKQRHPIRGGVILSEMVATKINANEGDTVRVSIRGSQNTIKVTVEAVASLGPMSPIVMDVERLQGLFGFSKMGNTILLATDEANHERIRDELHQSSLILRVQDMSTLRETVASFMGLGRLLTRVMLVLAILLAAVILYNMASLGVWERKRDLATLLALGHSNHRVFYWMSLELLFAAFGALVFSIPISVLIASFVLDLYSNAFMPMPFILSGATVGLVCIAIISAIMLSLIFPILALVKTPFSETLRNRD